MTGRGWRRTPNIRATDLRSGRGRAVTVVNGTIIHNVRRERRWQDMSQDDVATAMNSLGHNWGRSTVSKIESAERQLTAAEFVDLAKVFSVSMLALIEDCEVTL